MPRRRPRAARLARQVISNEEYAGSRELPAELASREAFGRAAEPREVASIIAFLASDYASCLITAVISVSGQHPRRRGA